MASDCSDACQPCPPVPVDSWCLALKNDDCLGEFVSCVKAQNETHC